MKKIATVHKVISDRQTVYRLTPPLVRTDWDDNEETHEYVVASCASHGYRAEVLIFPSDGEKITNWGEIGGSYGEEQGHISALKEMGYRLGGSPEEIHDAIRRSGRNAPKAIPFDEALADARRRREEANERSAAEQRAAEVEAIAWLANALREAYNL